MFVGHYGVSLAAKRGDRSIPLWVLFLAVQLLAVFSHWVLDLVVHRPDLPLYDNAAKVGLGLWNYSAPAFLLEVAALFGGMFLYLRCTTATTRVGRFGMPLFGVVMLAVQAFVFFGPPPSSDRASAVTSIGSYGLFAAVAGWLGSRRV